MPQLRRAEVEATPPIPPLFSLSLLPQKDLTHSLSVLLLHTRNHLLVPEQLLSSKREAAKEEKIQPYLKYQESIPSNHSIHKRQAAGSARIPAGQLIVCRAAETQRSAVSF